MRHRRKKRNDDEQRKSFLGRLWSTIKQWGKDYDAVQKELSDMGIYTNFSGWHGLGGGWFGCVDEEKFKKDVSLRSGEKRRDRNN
jgi:hypothetical protein